MTFERLTSLEGKVAVITGGCGQVGYATALRLAQQGARVISLVRRDIVEANEMMKRLPNPELDHFALLASVTDSAALKDAAKVVQERAGRCDILVNSAGTLKAVLPSNLHGLTDEIFDEIMTTNLRGVYATIREFSDMLSATGDGLIVNVSSQASQRASNSNVAYAASKAGVDLLTKTLAKSMAPKVRVLAVSPGYMVKATSGVVKAPDANAMLAASSPLKRIGWADDIASTIEACATHIRFATGTIFLIDGGRTL
jgi:NAD(P)-dependent dehydrogenase (short-subunit alcohol dehydrogenase family)